jgi:hypothetical protein
MEKNIVLQCPHCNDFFILLEINCAIFRHGIYKADKKQIDPHLSKEICDYYVENDLIYGCGKPFRVITKNNELTTEICDYI